MNGNGVSTLQRTVLEVLADGRPHTRDELIAELGRIEDNVADRTQLNNVLRQLRYKIRPKGHDIVCVLQNRRICYRRVMLLPGSTFDE